MAKNSASHRQDRVRKAMMREISDIIAREVKDPILANQVISVTDIDLSNDMSHARVYISVMGDETLRESIMSVLVAAKSQIRALLGQRIRLRHTPDLDLRYDDSLARGSRVTELLNQISRGEV